MEISKSNIKIESCASGKIRTSIDFSSSDQIRLPIFGPGQTCLPKKTDVLLNKLMEWEQKHKPLYHVPQRNPVASEEFKNNLRALGYIQ
jgi:hypothetical protein